MRGELTAIGFGRDKLNGGISRFLNLLDTQFIPNKIAKEQLEQVGLKNVVDDRVIFVAAHKNGIHRSVRHGDSGGPLFRFIGGKFILYGLASWVVNNPRIIAPSCFTRIGAFSKWIKDTITNEEPKDSTELQKTTIENQVDKVASSLE